MADTIPKSGGPVDPAQLADLAAAARILAMQGVVDGMGHVSMRHPSAPDRFLMSRAQAPALVMPDDIIEYDLDCNPCNADGRGSFLERFIHGAIYAARQEEGLTGYYRVDSPLTVERIRMACRDRFTALATGNDKEDYVVPGSF